MDKLFEAIVVIIILTTISTVAVWWLGNFFIYAFGLKYRWTLLKALSISLIIRFMRTRISVGEKGE